MQEFVIHMIVEVKCIHSRNIYEPMMCWAKNELSITPQIPITRAAYMICGGPVQNENMKPIKIYENFQGDNSSALQQAWEGGWGVKGRAAAGGEAPGGKRGCLQCQKVSGRPLPVDSSGRAGPG